MPLSIVSYVSMVPHPSSATPIDTFMGRGRHLRGCPVKKKHVQRVGGAGQGRAGHEFDHLVIEMKNKGYKPCPASSFFRVLCASQVGLGIGPDIGGSFGRKFPGSMGPKQKKIPTALWHPLRQHNVSQKSKSGGKCVC